MALPACQRSGRCLLPSLNHYATVSKGRHNSLTASFRPLRNNNPVSAHRFFHQYIIPQNSARNSTVRWRAGYAQYCSQGGVQASHPECHLPAISQNQQTLVIPRVDVDTRPEELEDVPDLSPLEVLTEEEAGLIEPHIPVPPDSLTLQDYVDHSETLQKLVLLGVDLSKLEKRPNVGTFLLKLDFEKDISKILLFLKDLGLEDSQLGPFLTKNPFILREDIDKLHKRVAYLSSKKFSKSAITQIVARAPYLLNFSVDRLDNRLGFFQKQLGLSAENTRDLVTRLPRMVTGSLEPVKENLKVFEIELGFRKNEIQHMALKVPKMLIAKKTTLTETFDFVHNTMEIPQHLITNFPQIFNSSLYRIKERHQFLTFLGRAIYDPTKPNYVSLDKLTSMPNHIFCEEVAKTSIQDFEQFQKSM
ncbi:transcription termination factor 3, mitochondrial [Pseudophryne corroboree]|uniref:transcription termination factor 3, mitochondrial n=1 Tax=Pseudophryne corroboree TaxID=495146 RepID=UPI003081672F